MVNTLRDVFHRALASDHGIALAAGNDTAAHRLRRQLYAEREKARREGIADFDGLSVLINGGEEVWVFRRHSTVRSAPALPQSRELTPDELPVEIRARGRSRLSLHGIFSHYAGSAK